MLLQHPDLERPIWFWVLTRCPECSCCAIRIVNSERAAPASLHCFVCRRVGQTCWDFQPGPTYGWAFDTESLYGEWLFLEEGPSMPTPHTERLYIRAITRLARKAFSGRSFEVRIKHSDVGDTEASLFVDGIQRAASGMHNGGRLIALDDLGATVQVMKRARMSLRHVEP